MQQVDFTNFNSDQLRIMLTMLRCINDDNAEKVDFVDYIYLFD